MDEIFSYFFFSFLPYNSFFVEVTFICLFWHLPFILQIFLRDLFILGYLFIFENGSWKSYWKPWVRGQSLFAVGFTLRCFGCVASLGSFPNQYAQVLSHALNEFPREGFTNLLPAELVICLLVCDLNAKRENKGKGLNTENLHFHITPCFHYGTPSFPQCAMMFHGLKSLIFTFFGEQISSFLAG